MNSAVSPLSQSQSAAPRAMHVITALNVGGAEKMLKKIATGLDPAAIDIVSLIEPGVTGQRLKSLGYAVNSLGMTRGVPSLRALAELRRQIAEKRPDALVGWMHHGFLLATLARFGMASAPPILWNVRHSIADIRHEPMQTRAVLHLCARLSSIPSAIIYNSRVARRQYTALGFDDSRATVIPNGFDIERFRPDAGARARLESFFGIDGPDPVIAMVARFHPMKSQETLIAAFRIALDRGARARLLLVGEGAENPPSSILNLVGTLPEQSVILSGHRTDLETWLPGVDILALSSRWGEAFPNVLGEAMAAGVPCVATDVGDSAIIIGDTGATAPPGDAAALAEALMKILGLAPDARKALGAAARARVAANYALGAVRAQYAEVIASACEDRAAAGRRR
jgi:glycosyltransferase involved in cell wall biosynthesis